MDGSRLTLRAALAADLLEDFVRQEEAHGVELEIGSDFERALALLLVQRDLCQETATRAGPRQSSSVIRPKLLEAGCSCGSGARMPRSQ
jgi:hypothetical protein